MTALDTGRAVDIAATAAPRKNANASLTTVDDGIDDTTVLAATVQSLDTGHSGVANEAWVQEEQRCGRASLGDLADDTAYWDLSAMAPLNAWSAAAVARLRAFSPPAFPLWDRLPLTRRAAVLVLLYADRRGDLRVVLTMRAASLRNFSGHAAFPGGKADSLDETPEQIARREAWEEIGLPMPGDQAEADLRRHGFRIEHLCSLPHNLAKTELAVRPCVALLQRVGVCQGRSTDAAGTDAADTDTLLVPRLDAREVAAVFSAPFYNFLLDRDEAAVAAEAEKHLPRPPGRWYEGTWTQWHGKPWRMHFFHVPVTGQAVAKPRPVRPSAGSDSSASDDSDSASAGSHLRPRRAILVRQAAGAPPAGDGDQKPQQEEGTRSEVAGVLSVEDVAVATNGHKDGDDKEDGASEDGRYKVWGMTARILVDAAMVAYAEAPAFAHNSHCGDEEVITALYQMGRLGEKKRRGSELTYDDMKKATEAAAATATMTATATATAATGSKI